MSASSLRRTMQGARDHAEPMISVVIPCFNYARYVGAAIECVLSQEYPLKELIVVNDGSTDESLDVIAQFQDRLRVIDQRNQGHIAACNRGFEATSGAIVMFLDADDLLEPQALSHVARAWSPPTAKVQFDVKIIDAGGRDLGRRFCHFTKEYDSARVRQAFRRSGTYRWPVMVGNAYARSFLESMFPLTVDHGPDGMLNTVAPLYGEIATIPKALGCYRLHGANRWSSDGSDHARLPERIGDRLREVEIMRRHARLRGVTVPTDNVLDHEIAFIGYRMMAWKLGLRYEGQEGDTPAALFWRACRVVRTERLPFRLGLAHVLWCGALLGVSRPVARALIRLRFNRGAIGPSVRRRVRQVLERFKGARKATP
jgi:glycosyltransferase involved in cell wall biosynthesis